MFEVILFNYGKRPLYSCMEELNNFLAKTSLEVVSVSHALNHDGFLEVLILLKDDPGKDLLDDMSSDPQLVEG